jgi:putative ABC transport system permease protein
MLMGLLSVLAIFLSVFLVINTISALMGQQIRQIGVMKAVGATTAKIVGIYLGLALAFGVIALIIAIPLAALASYGLTRFLIGLLNATPSGFSIPTASIVVQLVIGLAVPLLGALVPVLGGARLSVRQAITNYGLVSGGKPGTIDRLLEALPWLPRPLILSLRNTFHRKARLALTLATLVLGGAIFIAIFGVSESINQEVDQTARYYQADVNVDFDQFYPADEVETAVEAVPGVESVEGWSLVKGNVLREDGETSDQVYVFGSPGETDLVQPEMTEGRWLQPSDRMRSSFPTIS